MTEARCMVCGGLMVKQHVLNGCHRHKGDCIAHLRLAVKQLEPRAAFGDQCYQDRCENAYVEQSVVKRIEQLLNAAGSGKATAEHRLSEVCSERDALRVQLGKIIEVSLGDDKFEIQTAIDEAREISR